MKSAPSDAVPSDLPTAVAQILAPDGRVAGTGFLVAEDMVVTCAHVVEAAGGGPGGPVRLAFPHVLGAEPLEGTVAAELWRATGHEDVAFIRLGNTPTGALTLPLGSSEGCRGHTVRSFGFPAQAPPNGHLGFGEVGDLLPAADGRGAHLQLTDANDLTTGFSGGPVLDEVTGLVIGMLTEITAPDVYERGLGIAYATPTRVLREILPELTERDVCPYRGLEPFTAEHAQWFEGRSDAVRQVVANLAQQRRLTLLLGPSGSGKSSLLQAGVLRELAKGVLPGSDRWLPVLARPRQDMLAEIERAGLPGASSDGITAAVNARLAAEPSFQRVLLVIDQFEELLVQSTNGRLRMLLEVIDEVTSAADAYTKITVILIMRDDFYPQLAALAPRLLDAAMPGLLNVPGTLSQQDLHDIIVLPAENVGLRFQPGLPEQIISDVLETTPKASFTGQAPVTMLPLLEMSLRLLWDRRKDGFLTHDAYRRIGGVSGSVTTWCDSALDELSTEQQIIARRALTSLVHPTDPSHNITAVRNQVPLDELRDLAADPSRTGELEAVDAVITALTRRRIITTQTLGDPTRPGAPPGEPVAELIHESLIRDWGTLRKWVERDIRFQQWLTRARERRARWVEGKHHPGDLLSGTTLAEGLELSEQRRLPGDIEEFLKASKDHQRAAIRRSRVLNGVLSGLLVLALLAAGGVLWQSIRVGNAKERALSRELAAQADELLGTNPELAALLAVKAYRSSHTAEAIDSLGSVAALPAHRRMSGHTEEVRAVAYSPDRRIFASAGADNTVRLRDATTMKTLRRFPAHDNALNAVAFSPDSRILATAGADRLVRLWNPATGAHRMTLGRHTDQVRAVAFHPKKDIIATAGDDSTVHLWNTANGKHLRALEGHTGHVRTVAFHPEEDAIATGSDDNTVRLWGTADGTQLATIKEHTQPVTSVAFSPDGDNFATADGYDVHLRDPATGESRTVLPDTAHLIAFSPDSKAFATATDRFVQLWDTSTRAPRVTFAGHANAVLSLAFSPNSRTLATAGRDNTVRLWDATAGNDRTTLRGHTNAVFWLAFSPDGRTIASASADNSARLWNSETGRPEKKLSGHSKEVNAVAFHPDGDMVTTGSEDGTVRLWDTKTGASRPPLKDHDSPVRSVAFSRDGKTLATGGVDGTLLLRDAATGEARPPIDAHSEAVLDMAFSADNRVLATAGADSQAKLWDRSGNLLATLSGHNDPVTSVAFSPDGDTVATASRDGTVGLWNAYTGRSIAALTKHAGAVTAVAFHRDGDTLATGSEDGTVRLWDVATRKPRMTFLASLSGVNHLTFSPDGRTLATAGVDGTARQWNVAESPEPDKVIEQICRTFDRDLTLEERKAYLRDDSDASVCP
ncbi:trypsin-like peptidase domain-containing protein [Streptomyces sp. ISL-22]|uniref:nSTAND1 domain-containing NTPase n=1 Tax=unclassified Streptomyces TaxID=2593676 RepID=UPI001BE5DFD9|nr:MULTISPECIES: trypsin-like peptidase domain-containing protein [unclassified Streptomyces]MBT2418174.1 trypsin-like peptidase domain-containing protein [Streptomyces sp. ISL-24]MBT2431522.1 trypsin-like peptidase domain-containing protein [Streptomyces sp. ISL-22]